MSDPGEPSDDLDLDIALGTDDASRPNEQQQQAANFVGPYQLIQEVGAGGVARVFRARHIHPQYADRALVVKVLHPELSNDPKVVSLFRREAYVLALLKHPNIVQTFEAGAQDERLFIAMEYIDGRDLENFVLRCARAKLAMPMPMLLHIVGETLRALTYAHELRDNDDNALTLVHRDVNPANVFVSFDGRVKLGDFGVAAITAGRVEKSRELAGKVGYFAPEQLSGDAVDCRADLFALGVMMFELLCGERLFDHEDMNEAMRLNKRAKIPKPSKLNANITSQLEKVMLKALERKPNDRYASGRAMLDALAPLLPDPGYMSLGVSSLMRTAFLQEHLQELQLREGLAGRSGARQGKQRIVVVTAEERAQQGFRELLQSRGYEVSVHAELEDVVGTLTPLPAAVIIDVTSPNFSAEDTNVVLKSAEGFLPVVAVSQGYDETSMRRAGEIAAADLLVRPFHMERVLGAVRTALCARPPAAAAAPARTQDVPRALLISRDGNWRAGLQKALEGIGWRVETVSDGVLAMSHLEKTSPRMTIYDAFPASAEDRLFVGKLRTCVGMGLVPVLYIIDDAAKALLQGMQEERVAVTSRRQGFTDLAQAAENLRRDSTNSRIFIRYPADFEAELRYGGRVFNCRGTNLSRGGTMVTCSQIPPVGTQVSVAMHLGASRSLFSGRVMRVDLIKVNEQDTAQVGIEFDSFVGRSEADLIHFLHGLTRDDAAESASQINRKSQPRA